MKTKIEKASKEEKENKRRGEGRKKLQNDSTLKKGVSLSKNSSYIFLNSKLTLNVTHYFYNFSGRRLLYKVILNFY